MEINTREKLVLAAIIDYYLNSGGSAGSRTIVKKYNLEFSSATVRNVMADLEDMGLIEKTHTSSGRVPTSTGYKYYLETLIKIQHLSKKEMEKVHSEYQGKVNELENIFERTSAILSKMSSYAGIVLEPSMNKKAIKKVELVRVNENTLFAVIVMENSVVKTKTISLESKISEEEAREVSKFLNDRIQEINGEKKPEAIPTLVRADIVNAVTKECFENIQGKVYIKGSSRVVESLVDETRDFMNTARLLEGENDIKVAFEAMVKRGNWQEGKVNVLFGEELGVEDAKNLSFVFSVYNIGENQGVIGVIGPRRMEYSKTVGLVEYVSNEVNKVIDKLK